VAGQPGKRRRGVAALGDEDAVGGLDVCWYGSQAAYRPGCGNGAIVNRWSRVSPSSTTSSSSAGLSFSADRAGDRRGGAEPGDLLPAVHAAMAIDGQFQQVIQWDPPFAPG